MAVEPLQTLPLQCPYCGEVIEVLVDCSSGDQEYVEDCQVCCEPMVVTVSLGQSDGPRVSARRENP